MEIATYNIRLDTTQDQDWSWAARAFHVCELLAFHQWDIIGLQEVRPNQKEDLMKLPYTMTYYEREGDGSDEGLVLLSDPCFTIKDQGFFWLSDTPNVSSIHPEAGCKRIAMWVVYQKGQEPPFLVINTHLDHISESARYEGMRVLLQELQDKIARYQTILLGDFNALPDERVHTLLKGFTDVKELTSQYYGPKGTFQDFDYTRAWSDLEEIDYIYAKGFSVSKVGCVTDSCDQRFPSDHFPLVATVTQTK